MGQIQQETIGAAGELQRAKDSVHQIDIEKEARMKALEDQWRRAVNAATSEFQRGLESNEALVQGQLCGLVGELHSRLRDMRQLLASAVDAPIRGDTLSGTIQASNNTFVSAHTVLLRDDLLRPLGYSGSESSPMLSEIKSGFCSLRGLVTERQSAIGLLQWRCANLEQQNEVSLLVLHSQASGAL
jgi:hypothetical protein